MEMKIGSEFIGVSEAASEGSVLGSQPPETSSFAGGAAPGDCSANADNHMGALERWGDPMAHVPPEDRPKLESPGAPVNAAGSTEMPSTGPDADFAGAVGAGGGAGGGSGIGRCPNIGCKCPGTSQKYKCNHRRIGGLRKRGRNAGPLSAINLARSLCNLCNCNDSHLRRQEANRLAQGNRLPSPPALAVSRASETPPVYIDFLQPISFVDPGEHVRPVPDIAITPHGSRPVRAIPVGPSVFPVCGKRLMTEAPFNSAASAALKAQELVCLSTRQPPQLGQYVPPSPGTTAPVPVVSAGGGASGGVGGGVGGGMASDAQVDSAGLDLLGLRCAVPLLLPDAARGTTAPVPVLDSAGSDLSSASDRVHDEPGNYHLGESQLNGYIDKDHRAGGFRMLPTLDALRAGLMARGSGAGNLGGLARGGVGGSTEAIPGNMATIPTNKRADGIAVTVVRGSVPVVCSGGGPRGGVGGGNPDESDPPNRSNLEVSADYRAYAEHKEPPSDTQEEETDPVSGRTRGPRPSQTIRTSQCEGGNVEGLFYRTDTALSSPSSQRAQFLYMGFLTLSHVFEELAMGRLFGEIVMNRSKRIGSTGQNNIAPEGGDVVFNRTEAAPDAITDDQHPFFRSGMDTGRVAHSVMIDGVSGGDGLQGVPDRVYSLTVRYAATTGMGMG